MNYKKELTKFIEEKIVVLLKRLQDTIYQMNHLNSDYPKEELMAEIKKSTHSINGVLLNLFGNKYIKKTYLKIKKENLRAIIDELRDEKDEYVTLLECVDKGYYIKKNALTINILIEFAASKALSYPEFVELLKSLGVKDVEIDGVMAIVSANEKYKNLVYVQSLINAHKLGSQEEQNKEELLAKKEMISQLSTYVSKGKIIKTTNTIEEFETILAGLDLSEEAKNKLINSMSIAIREKESKKDRGFTHSILKGLYNEALLEIVKTAERIIDEEPDNRLYGLIKKSYRNIVSLCKYLDIMPMGSSEWNNIFSLLDAEMLNLENTIHASKDNTLYGLKRFNYLIKDDESLQAKEDIELLDVTTYNDISIAISNLQNGTYEVKEEKEINGIKVQITDGIVKIAFTEIDGVRVIIAIAQSAMESLLNQRLNNKTFISSLYSQVRKALEDPKAHELNSLHHEIIMRYLDVYIHPIEYKTGKLV